MTNEEITRDLPSRRMLKNWAKRIAQGTVKPIPVYVGGAWSLQIMRGKKRRLMLELESIEN